MALTLVIGNKNYSSWSFRPWLVLRQAKLAFDEIVIPLDQPETRATIARYSPAGRVPVMLEDGFVIWDSLAIVERLAELAPEAHLWPEGQQARAVARSISAEMHSGFWRLRRACPMNLRRRIRIDVEPEVLQEAERVIELWTDCILRFGQLERDRPGPFLFGAFTIADAMYAPVCSRFRTYGLPTTSIVDRYLEAVWNHPDVAQWVADAEREPWSLPAYDALGS